MVIKEITTLTIIGKDGSVLVLNDLRGIRLSLENDSSQATLFLSPNDEQA